MELQQHQVLIQYDFVSSSWKTNIGLQDLSEREIERRSLEPRATPFIMDLVILIFSGWEMFDTSEENLVKFVTSALEIPRPLIKDVLTRKNRAKNYVKLHVHFRAPYSLDKKPGFFTANLIRTYTSHEELSTYFCRLEQPKIEDYITLDMYNTFINAIWSLPIMK